MLFAQPWSPFGKTEDSLATGSPRVVHVVARKPEPRLHHSD
jgi:hypothetical protein